MKRVYDLDRFVQEVADLLVEEKITVEEFAKRLKDYYGKGDRWVTTGSRSTRSAVTDSTAT